MRRQLAVVAVALATLVGAGAARAQGPAYSATPPTKGALYGEGQDGRYLLGGTWLFQADRGNVGLSEGWWRGVAATDGWSPVTVPNSYNAGDFSITSMDGYIGWYRRDFTLPAHAFGRYVPRSARAWIIRFESVNYRATVWLNGHKIGSNTGAYLPFEFTLPPRDLRGGVNRLIVRVDDRRSPSDMPRGPGGLWFNYGGLQREVYLRAVQIADLQQVQVRPILPCPTCAAQIQERALVRNVTSSPQTVHLRGAYGRVRLDFGAATIRPNGTWTAQASARIAHPSLWEPGHPYLYDARLTLLDSRSRQIGGYFSYSGIRSIKVTADGRLELNGRLLNIRGVNIHESSVSDGAALDTAQLAQLIDWTKQVGGTMIRAHYPVGPQIEEMADRDGILLWSEVPVYQLPGRYLAQPSVLNHGLSILRQNILDNQNNPSVLLWSIGNELDTPVSRPEAHYISLAASLARKLDPTRPVGLAISDWPGVPCQSAYAPLDVLGINDYFGWFDAGAGATDDRDQLGPFLDSARGCYRTKALMVTEFGFDANRNGPVEVRGTYQFQANSVAYHLGVFAAKPWLSGALIHPLQDFANNPNYSGGNPFPEDPWDQKGVIDQYGNFKPAFAVVQSIFRATRQIGPVPPTDSGRRRGRR